MFSTINVNTSLTMPPLLSFAVTSISQSPTLSLSAIPENVFDCVSNVNQPGNTSPLDNVAE